MLNFSNLTLQRGTKLLFKHTSFMIHPGQRVGLTGANGTGKSSLFSLIMKELEQEEGEFGMPSDWVIAHVKQETPSVNVSALEYALQGDDEFIELQEAMEQAEGEELANLIGRFEAIGGYEAELKGTLLLRGLGFQQAQLAMQVKSFSGGWRMRLNLAQALMCRSDLLLLDEPTNHWTLIPLFGYKTGC